MNLKNRLRKLEQTKRQVSAEADCICFPPGESPQLELQQQIEAAKAVHCPLHGERFKKWATTIYRVIGLPRIWTGRVGGGAPRSPSRRWMPASPPTSGRRRRSWNRMGRCGLC